MKRLNSRAQCMCLLGVMGFMVAACAAPPLRTLPTSTAVATPTTLNELVSSSAKFEPVVTGDNLFEGPLYLPDGRWIVSEIAANVVWQFDGNWVKTAFLQPSNNANGHALTVDHRIIQAEHGSAALAQVTLDGKHTTLVDRFETKHFNSPNDCAIKSDGSIWFTDPTFGLGDRPGELGFTGVFRFVPSTGEVILLTQSLTQPNGIGFSLDERTLYVSASGRITAFPIDTNGTLGAGRDFGPGNDGLKVDAFGNVWSTGHAGVDVIRADGTLLGTLPLPEDSTNIAFGGQDGKTVVVTTFKGMYRLQANVSLTP